MNEACKKAIVAGHLRFSNRVFARRTLMTDALLSLGFVAVAVGAGMDELAPRCVLEIVGFAVQGVAYLAAIRESKVHGFALGTLYTLNNLAEVEEAAGLTEETEPDEVKHEEKQTSDGKEGE